MNSFYETFERNVTGLSNDVVKAIRSQVEEVLETFPKVKVGGINVEMECRYKNATTDKVIGPLLMDLDGMSSENPSDQNGLRKSTNNIIDVNHNIGKQQGYFFTVRESTLNEAPSPTLYAKTKVFFHKNSTAYKVLEFFESMGLKLSFSLEIQSKVFCEELLQKAQEGKKVEPLKRIKQRLSYVDPASQFSFDITQVVQSNTMRKENEVEIDYTSPFDKFTSEMEPVGKVKSFISFCEEKGRTIIYRTRTLVQQSILEEAILNINRGLGVENPREWRIEKKIPQVRNFQVQDLLKENYKGYGTTPKADGYRYFMVILKNCIMLVRPPNIYKVLYEGKDIPDSWVGFVFDGELIERENWREENVDKNFLDGVDNYYCIFDVLGFPSEELFPSNQREGVLRRINGLKTFFEEVRRNSRIGMFRWSNNYNSIYFQPVPNTRVKTPVMKTFFEIKPYDDSTETTWYSSDAFFESLKPKLRYKDDGLIFTPDKLTYPQLSEPENLSLKWKPLDMLSIDFRYKSNGDLFVWKTDQDEDSEPEEREIPFRGTSFFPLSKEQIRIDNPENIRLANDGIYEFIFDTNRKVFRVTRPRYDKSMPNTAKDSAQIWTDYNRPVTEKLIRGMGIDGVIEAQRESMWTWVENLLSKANGPIFDFTDFQPAIELPIRFLENLSFGTLMKNIPVYRLTKTFSFDFPQVRTISNASDLPEIDILILNGQQLMMLEGREQVYAGDYEALGGEYYIDTLKFLVSKSKRVFVRNLTTIIPRELPTLFHPDRSAYGNEEEMVVTRISDETVDVEMKLPGAFYDVSTGGYNSILRSRAHLRNFQEPIRYVSAGHRIKNEQLEDNGPERILGGKHFGKLFDYLYNVLLPSSYFQPYLQRLFTQTDPNTTTPLDDIIERAEKEPLVVKEIEKTVDTSEELETISAPKFNFERVFETEMVADKEFLEKAELVRESNLNPDFGDVFDMICKAVTLLQDPKNVYDPSIVSKRAAELRLLLGGLVKTPVELARAIYERLGLGLVFLRRLKNSNTIDSYYSTFFEPETLNSPRFGFLLIESRLEAKDLFSRCSLLSYRSTYVIHPKDPILAMLYQRPIITMDLIELKLKIAPLNSGKIELGEKEKKEKKKVNEKNKTSSTIWSSLHRLFNSMRYIYPNAPDANREYLQEIREESTDNKADYLIDMEVPNRFRKQTWGVTLLETIDKFTRKGVRPDPLFEDRAENEFARLLEGFTEKNRRELLATGNAFLFDPTYPDNLYGKGLMYFRSTIKK